METARVQNRVERVSNFSRVQNRVERVSNFFPYLLLVIAGLGLGVTVILRRFDLTIFSLIIVIPLVIAALVVLANKRTNIRALPAYIVNLDLPRLVLLNSIIFITSIILLVVSTTRPLAYFILIAMYSGVLFIQIVSTRPKWTDHLIVLQIVFLSLNLIWGVTLKYSLYFGDTDLLVHMNLIDTIVKTGHISPYNLDYLHYPLYHVFIALGVEITDGLLSFVLFIIMGLFWQIGIIFSYLIFRRLSGSSKFAGIACLLFALSSQTIFYGSYSIPRSLAFVFFICWLYLIIMARNDNRYLFLSLIALAAMIMTHHLTVISVIPALVLLYVAEVTMKRFRHHPLIDPLFIYLLVVSSVSYLMWVSFDMMEPRLTETILAIMSEPGIKSDLTLTHGMGFSVIFGTLFYSFAFFLSLLGIQSFFNRLIKHQRLSGGFVLTGIIALIVYVPGFMYLFPFSDTILTDRLILIVSPFVVLLMVYGVEYLRQGSLLPRLHSGTLMTSAILPAILLVATSFFSIISIGNAKDTNYFPHTATIDSPYFTKSEMMSFSFLNNKGDTAIPLYSDYATFRNDYMLATFPNRGIIRVGSLLDIGDGYVMIRTAELEKKQSLGFLSATSESIGMVEYPIRYSIDELTPEINALSREANGSKIYSDNDVQLYLMKSSN